MRLRQQIAAGLQALVPAPRRKVVTAWGDQGWHAFGATVAEALPGTYQDFAARAGDLWRNSTVSIALRWQADTFGEAPNVVRRQDPDGEWQEVPGHPLLPILDSPMPYYDGSVLFAGIHLSLAVDGNAYLYLVRSAAGKLVGLQWLPHFLVEPKGGGPDGWIGHYEYHYGVGKTLDLPPEDVCHLRDGLDPRNQFLGLSRLAALVREVCTANEAATYTAGLLHNSGLMRLLISPKSLPDGKSFAFTPDQARSLKTLWQQGAAVDQQTQPIVPTIPIEVSTPGYSPEQMGLKTMQRLPTDMICAALGVAAMVLDLPSENKTYSNVSEARRSAYENVTQLHRMVDRQLTRRLMPLVVGAQPGDVLGRDYSDVRALQEDVDNLHERAREDYRAGLITRATGLRMIGEPFDEVADAVYVTDLAGAGNVANAPEGAPRQQTLSAIRRYLASAGRRPPVPYDEFYAEGRGRNR